ncbi:MAG: hypothetical protein K2H29_06330 [Oscillospiraceae bacterium]|nr:hypothetical protein [Oscillospiraceae bacterium]
MNQKKIRKLLHHMNEQTAKKIADEYPATDQATKEKIYHQICERRNAMNEKKETISETYHTPYVKFVSWTKTFGIATACMLIMGGTIGGIWKLTRLNPPSEELNSMTENNSNTDISTTNQTESTTSSETLTTTQALAVIATSTDVTTTHTEMSTTTTSMMISTMAATMQTAPVTVITTATTIPAVHKETVIISETEPIITDSVPESPEPPITAPPIPETTVITTPQSETMTTRPAYLKAYLEICENDHQEFGGDNTRYGLYDIDKDTIPELIINHTSYWMDMYSYADDQIYTIMDRYPYGAGGNTGYRIYPFENCITYSFTEFAGLIHYDCFLTITPEHTLEETDMLTSYIFHDDNNDGIPQEEEINRDGSLSKCYLNNKEITLQEYEQFQNEHAIEEIGLDIDKSYDEIVAQLTNY